MDSNPPPSVIVRVSEWTNCIVFVLKPWGIVIIVLYFLGWWVRMVVYMYTPLYIDHRYKSMRKRRWLKIDLIYSVGFVSA